jgi:hypothetical protein
MLVLRLLAVISLLRRRASLKRNLRSHKVCLLSVAIFSLLCPSVMLSGQDALTGTVTGHVYCTDTNLPARLAHVFLDSVPAPKTPVPKSKADAFRYFSTQTRTDGSFTFAHIPPGEYFASVNYGGYLSPDWKFTHDTIRNPTPEQRIELLKTIPNVTVAANKTVMIEVPIQRGAAISGTIRFDDGAPFVQTEVKALLRDSRGKWNSLPVTGLPHSTDDLGRFRIADAPPGEYTLAVEMSLQDTFGKWSSDTRRVYYGDGFLERDAKTFKVTEGEDFSDIEITVRLSKLHSITGYLVDPNGQVINAGDITILTIPDQIEIAKAEVSTDDSTYHLDFIPEGHYLLRVTNPRNVSRQTILPPAGFVQIPTTKEAAILTFKPYEAPLDVLTDLPNFNVSIQAIGPVHQ